MANVYVPGRSIDCEWADGIEIGPHDIVVTKHHADAGETASYRDAIEQPLRNGATRVALAGLTRWQPQSVGVEIISHAMWQQV